MAVIALHWLRQRTRPSLVLVCLGLLSGGTGTALGLAASTTVSAATTLSVCGTSAALMPGSSGSCQETFANPYVGHPVKVVLRVSSASMSAGGKPGSALGTEALLDGTQTGLQVQIINDSTGQLFLVGPVACYTSAELDQPAAYPNASYCVSDTGNLPVTTAGGGRVAAETFTVRWLMPLAAGNPYQGGSASVTVQPVFTNLSTPAGGVLGQSTTAPGQPGGDPGAGQHQGVLGAQTPSTGADLPIALSRLLIVVGLLMFLGGLWLWRQRRYPTGKAADRPG
ncbi:MAG: hypothetical protein M0027_14445 [Candidatus Dormibacteraeota bacterium]|jgi:hypothetical protein|nr:hypothetical protein [Candidatus Dormibacteraeota bacterium]